MICMKFKTFVNHWRRRDLAKRLITYEDFKKNKRSSMYLSISYNNAYLEYITLIENVLNAFEMVVSEVPIEIIKKTPSFSKLLNVIKDLYNNSNYLVSFNTIIRGLFEDIFSYVNFDTIQDKLEIMNIYRSGKTTAESVTDVIGDEYNRLLQENEDFRRLVISVLFCVKNYAYYVPKIYTENIIRSKESNYLNNEYSKLYKSIQELIEEIKQEEEEIKQKEENICDEQG